MIIHNLLEEANTVAILGHVRPDGDCVGSTLALLNYINDNFPTIKADIFLESFAESYKLLNYSLDANKYYSSTDNEYPAEYDLVFVLDTPSYDRIGANGYECLVKAKKSCNIDHHISNPMNLCTVNIVDPGASSASELLYYELDSAKISRATADCLYLGIVHDTGAFKFSCTSKKTMEAIGDLLDKGIDFAKIVNETYYTRTYIQTIVTGFVMQRCKLALNSKVVYSYITPEEMKEFCVTPVEMNNIIDTLREVSGTEVAIFLYPVKDKYKISLRSNYIVDVNKIAQKFNGGGHTRAAGGETSDPPEVAIDKLLEMIDMQL